MAGHSLGELSALAAAGVIEPDAAIELAVRRGHAMQVAAVVVDGGRPPSNTCGEASI